MNGLGLSAAKGQYPYGVSSDQKWWVGDGVNDYISGVANTPYIWSDIGTQDLSLSFWIRIDSTTKKSQFIFSISASNSSTDNHIFVFYSHSTNRLIYRVRFGGDFYQRQFPLHDNSVETGISSSSTGWTSSQRGNVNDDGFCNITFTHDASGNAGGIVAYWNGESLDSKVTNDNTVTKTNWNPAHLGIGDSIGHANPSNGVLGGAINEIKLYSSYLTASEISDIYNNGVVANASTVEVTDNLITEWRLNDDVIDLNGKFDSTNNGGTFS